MATPLLDRLIKENKILFGADYRAGHVVSVSGLTPNTITGIRFERTGLDIGNTGTVVYTLAEDPFYTGAAQRDVTILCKQKYFLGAITGRLFSIAEKAFFYTYSTSENFRVSWDSGTTTVKSGDDFKQRETSWVAVTRNGAAATASIYKNGVLSGAANQACGATSGYGTAFSVGNRASDGARPFNSIIYALYIVSGRLSASEIQQLQNELDSLVFETNTYKQNTYPLIQFKTDFGVIQSTASEGGLTNKYLSNTPFQFTNTTGRFKVSTDVHENSLVKIIECVTGAGAGQGLSLDFGYTNTNWEYWYKASGGTVYTKVTDNSRITASGTKVILTMAAGDKMILADIKGDYCLSRRF